jgi:hypothetical protein
MLSCEQDASEVQWSVGTYVPVAEVARAFGVTLEAPVDIAPNQPFAYIGLVRAWPIVAAIVMVLAILVFNTRGTRTLLDTHVQLADAPPGAPFVWFSDSMDLRPSRNLEVELSAPVSNSWAYVAGDFVNDGTGLVQEFEAPIEYYFGVEGGESWNEGAREKRVYLSALPAGPYTLRLEIQAEHLESLADVHVVVRQGVPRWTHFWLLLLGVSIVPLVALALWVMFEKQRWGQSDAAGSGGGDED